MKSFAIMLALMLTLGSAFAEVDSQAFKVINDIQNGRDNNNQIKTLRVLGNAAIGGTLAVTGALTAPGGLTTTGDISVDDLTVTDDVLIGGDVTASGSVFTTNIDIPSTTTNSLYLGAANAANVVLAADGTETHVDGSLNVDEATTLGTELVINGDRIAITTNLVVAPGAVTATMTNAPALAAAASPVWVTIEIDGEDYVLAAFKKQ